VCNATDVQNPRGSVEDTSNEEFTEFNQISPLRVNITLRRGEPVSFPLRIKPARNYPLDLYLLMDLSYSMRDDLSNLKTLGTQIATAISGITTNFKLGFGAFVDKRVAPYVSIVPNTLIDPCGANCEGPYSFRHVISLVNDSDQFNVSYDYNVNQPYSSCYLLILF
jgi:protocadherin alpha